MTLLNKLTNGKNIWGRTNKDLNERSENFFSDKKFKNSSNKIVKEVMSCQHDFHDEEYVNHQERGKVMVYYCDKCSLSISINGNGTEFFPRIIC